MYGSESLVWFSHFRGTLCCTKFPPFTSICTSSRKIASQKGEVRSLFYSYVLLPIYTVFLVNGLHPYSRTPQCHISIHNLAGCCYVFASAVIVVGHMLRAQGRVPVISFVFERTFSCLTPLPYSATNSRIAVSRLISSSLLPVHSVIAGCLFGRVLMFGVSPFIIFSA